MRHAITALLAMIVLTLLLGVAYPLAVTGVSQVLFPGNADGQRLYLHGRLVGSRLIGQAFGTLSAKGAFTPDPELFQTRPSGTTPIDNAAASTFANYGPNSTITRAAIAGNIRAYLALNCATGLTGRGTCGRWYDPKVTSAAAVPVDAADTSASGIDPDISPANARIQAYRIAALRHLSLARVDDLIAQHTAGRGLGFSGEPGVDVLELNLALLRLHERIEHQR
jgi:K+-transporting ATPase ATPase C chain